jgi:hypothetical protein
MELSHLLFVDDTILVWDAIPKQIGYLRRVLCFKAVSA